MAENRVGKKGTDMIKQHRGLGWWFGMCFSGFKDLGRHSFSQSEKRSTYKKRIEDLGTGHLKEGVEGYY